MKLGGTSATGVTVVNSNAITATTPAHAAGAVSVVVTNTDAKSGTLTNGYTYTGPQSNPAPTVTAITPNSGTTNGGTSVTITGTGFLSGATSKAGRDVCHQRRSGEQHHRSPRPLRPTPPEQSASWSPTRMPKSGTLTNGYTYTRHIA